jgi:pimeloyl-ACP methyl ester carboxylesterase
MEKGTNKVYIDESIKRFNLQPDSKHWLYHDFDRLFDLVISSTGSSQKQYDIFGHSAGGQILHRFALLFPDSKANRILASNSGSYTVPNSDTTFPFGVSNLDLNPSQLKKAFQKNLVIFLGKLDNENETGGLILRSPTVDKQGTHRLARGKYFHSYSKTYAKKINSAFNWDLFIVPNVGHNQKLMAKAAAQYLYE